MRLEPYTLAMLPIAHLAGGIDPFDRYCRGEPVLEDFYRPVVNIGIRAYQLHTYLDLMSQYFGAQTGRLVQEHQLVALDSLNGTGQAIKNALVLIDAALETRAVRLPKACGEVEVPIEMNVALLLLLDVPQSPDFVSNPALRERQIERIGPHVDWCFADGLAGGRGTIIDIFLPMFADMRNPVRSVPRQ